MRSQIISMRSQSLTGIISSMERHSFYADDAGQGVSNKKYWSTTHNIGIEVPKTVEDSMEIDCKMGNDLWDKDISKDMTNVRISFENLNGVTPE